MGAWKGGRVEGEGGRVYHLIINAVHDQGS